MKAISAMNMRKHFGEYLDEVKMKSERIILERAGKAVAMLVPVSDATVSDIPAEAVKKKLQALKQLKGIGRKSATKSSINDWLAEERGSWERMQ